MRSISRLAMVAALGACLVSLSLGGCSSSEDETASATPNKGLRPGGKSGAGGEDGDAGGASGNSAGGEDGNAGGASGSNAGGASGNNAGGASGSAGGASGNNAGGASGGNAGGASGNNAGGASGNGSGGTGVSNNSCTSSADCIEANFSVCDPVTSLCVSCVTNADCADPERKICHENLCVECTEDAECVGHPNGPHCAVTQRKCTCNDNAECANSPKGKLCDVDFLERCAECLSSFDCKSPSAAGCSIEGTCSTANACWGDDAYESMGDDGPSGAVDISPPPIDPLVSLTTSALAEGHGVCDMPFEEADWFKFTIEGPSRVVANLSWGDANADLDLVIYDAAGRMYGFDYNRRPAVVTLTHLATGTYYASVTRAVNLEDPTLNVTPYTFEVTRTMVDPCTSVASCADDYGTQLFRGTCDGTKACRFIDGNHGRAKGALCDSDDDCSSGFCSYTPFMHGASTRSFCTDACDEETGCDGGLICSDFSYTNVCTAKCAVDEDCYAPLSHKPKNGLPWAYLHCDTATGECK